MDGAPHDSLAMALRRAGAKRVVVGCDDGRCGACRAIVDGALVSTCRVTLDALSEGAVVETADSLEADAPARAALRVFEDERPTRCRMCTGALAVTADALARALASGREPEAALEELVRDATCMCTGRGSWRRALAFVQAPKRTPASPK